MNVLRSLEKDRKATDQTSAEKVDGRFRLGVPVEAPAAREHLSEVLRGVQWLAPPKAVSLHLTAQVMRIRSGFRFPHEVDEY